MSEQRKKADTYIEKPVCNIYKEHSESALKILNLKKKTFLGTKNTILFCF